MADGEEKSSDFYGVLELKKECTTAELRTAYKKLALKWHPDRCSASGEFRVCGRGKEEISGHSASVFCAFGLQQKVLYDLGIHYCDDQDDEDDWREERCMKRLGMDLGVFVLAVCGTQPESPRPLFSARNPRSWLCLSNCNLFSLSNFLWVMALLKDDNDFFHFNVCNCVVFGLILCVFGGFDSHLVSSFRILLTGCS